MFCATEAVTSSTPCGWVLWLQDRHDARHVVSSTGRGGLGSSSQAATGDGDGDEDDVDQRHEELSPSQLHDAPSTQPTQPPGTRRCRPHNPYTSGSSALGHKGKDKTRRQ